MNVEFITHYSKDDPHCNSDSISSEVKINDECVACYDHRESPRDVFLGWTHALNFMREQGFVEFVHIQKFGKADGVEF